MELVLEKEGHRFPFLCFPRNQVSKRFREQGLERLRHPPRIVTGLAELYDLSLLWRELPCCCRVSVEVHGLELLGRDLLHLGNTVRGKQRQSGVSVVAPVKEGECYRQRPSSDGVRRLDGVYCAE